MSTNPAKRDRRRDGNTPSDVRGEMCPRHAAIRRALCTWYRSNARPLPWRGVGDPYAVWVSEVMLQQTQIAAVIPFYQRFMETFPTVTQLAEAPLERVLQRWSGLGYYRRARHLHQAAQLMVANFAGRLPREYAALRSLSGVGDYTAKAILSIAFDQPYVALDGNAARVVARLRALRGNLHQGAFRRRVETELENLLARRSPGDFNQAIMELGQTICLPKGAHCPDCPISKWCETVGSAEVEATPLPRPRRPAELHHLAVALLTDGSLIAMVRGLGDGLLEDLWNFPAAFGPTFDTALENLRGALATLLRVPFTLDESGAEFRHTITYRAIRGRVYRVQLTHSVRRAGLRWFPVAQLSGAAISQLARKAAQAAQIGQ